jgi:hypothetical protein
VVVAPGSTSSDVRWWQVPKQFGGSSRSGHERERERESVMWACGARRGRVPAGLSPLTFVGHPVADRY